MAVGSYAATLKAASSLTAATVLAGPATQPTFLTLTLANRANGRVLMFMALARLLPIGLSRAETNAETYRMQLAGPRLRQRANGSTGRAADTLQVPNARA